MIYQKLLAARQAMGAFAKDGKHAQGWKYFQSDAVLEQVGNALAAQGIVFLPNQTDARLDTVTETDDKGKTKTVETAFVTFEMTFVEAETGEVIKVLTHGSARDYGDKALFKAQTLAIKYLFLRMFLKGEGDDEPEAVSAPPARQAAPRTPIGRQPQNAPEVKSPAPSNGQESDTLPAHDSIVDRAAPSDGKSSAWATTSRVGRLCEQVRSMRKEEDGTPYKLPHVYHSIACALNLQSRPTTRDGLALAIQNEWNGSDKEAWEAILAYIPTAEREAEEVSS
jgi:hypothetical protein